MSDAKGISKPLNERKKPKFKFQILNLNLKTLIFIWLVLSVVGLSPREVRSQDPILVPAGATWKYLDNGSDQGTAWRAPSFDDSSWLAGPAELGYGDGDEATVVSFGPDPNNKFITTYFRHSFNVADASILSSLTLRVLRDDGAVVYLNGAEVFRTNMPAGAITSATPATSAVGGADETTFQETSVDPGLLVDGTNVLAVEIHQVNGTSSDISFNLELAGGLLLTRGPYLQMGSPTSLIVKWRTGIGTDSRVSYGTDPGSLTNIVDDPTLTTEHEITLIGLTSNTKYYYSIGTTGGVLAGGDADHFFVTSPAVGTAKNTRVWVIGDSGTCGPPQPECASARAVRDAYQNFTGTRGTDLWLMLGDNAYFQGTDPQYQAAVFDTYLTLLRNTVLWPSPGNHDTVSSPTCFGLTCPYYDIFTVPASAEAGGVVSGTEAFYSFDYGNIHFISLDSTTFDFDHDLLYSDMKTWLASDLAATTQDWVIAYWHYPPYSHGSHNSDTEPNLIPMHEEIAKILEGGDELGSTRGVDLVLTGHSHNYERSFLIDRFYHTPTTTDGTDGTILDLGDGRVDSPDGAYSKPTLVSPPHEGTVYVVAGSSGGQLTGGTLDHPVMFFSTFAAGSLVLDVNGNRLDAKFIDSTCAIQDDNTCVRDHFTIVKAAQSDLSVTKTDSPDPLALGSDLTYTVIVVNNGPDTATGVVVTDTLPAGVTFVSSSASQGSCGGISAITCNLGSLVSGASATATIVVTPTAATGISNTATVTGKEADPNLVNNTAAAVTTVNVGQPRLSGRIAAKGVQSPGVLFVDLRLTNTGTGNARNISLNQVLLRTLSGSGTVTYNSPPLPLGIGNLDVGASTTVRLFVNVPSTVKKFSLTENGTVQDVVGTNFSFSIGQAVIP